MSDSELDGHLGIVFMIPTSAATFKLPVQLICTNGRPVTAPGENNALIN